MQYSHRPAFTSLAATMLLLFSLLGLTACGGKQTPSPTFNDRPLTGTAQSNYDYLVYQDQLSQLQRHNAMGERSKLTAKEVNDIALRAEAALDRILDTYPTPQLYLEKAGLHWNDTGGLARSRSILKEGLTRFPDDQLLTVYLANSYILDNRIQAAIDVMDDYLAKKPDDMIARERLGQMLLDAGKYAEALDVLKAIPEAQRSADAYYVMGRAQGGLKMRKAAILNLKKAIQMDAGFTEAMVELAYQYELAKDYVAAEQMYTRILGQGDPFPEARLRLINLNLKLNNPARALSVTLEGPHSKSFILDAVLMFINEKFYAQGSTALDMLTSMGEIPSEYYFYKAVIANEGESDPQKALDFLTKVKKDDRLYPHALRFKAQLLHAQDKTDKALDIARKGRQLYPDGTIFYILESALLEATHKNAEAEALLRKGLAHLPNNPEIAYELAILLENADRRHEGLLIMEQVLRHNPDNVDALNYVGYTLAEEGRELERALVLVQKASTLEPESAYIQDSIAWVYFKMKNYPKAWEFIRYAVSNGTNEPTLWEHYGDIARAMGKTKAARKGYQKALKFNPKNADSVKQKLKEL